jgi:transposase
MFMVVVGIDISKYKHDAYIMTDGGEVVLTPFSFQNDKDGFDEFFGKIEKYTPDEVRIGFEATGNYALNLKCFLEKKGYSFTEHNPLLVKNWIQGKTLRRTKTDKSDCVSIADYTADNPYVPYPVEFRGGI